MNITKGKGWEETGTAALAFSFSLFPLSGDFPLSALAEGGITECV